PPTFPDRLVLPLSNLRLATPPAALAVASAADRPTLTRAVPQIRPLLPDAVSPPRPGHDRTPWPTYPPTPPPKASPCAWPPPRSASDAPDKDAQAAKRSSPASPTRTPSRPPSPPTATGPPCGAAQPCTCRECHPGRSGGVLVLAENAAEAVTSMDVEVGEPVRVGDRFGQRGEWSGVGDALVRAVGVVEDLVLA